MTVAKFGLILGSAYLLSSCSLMTAAGPSSKAIAHSRHQSVADVGIRVVDVTDAVARRVMDSNRLALFSEGLGDGLPIGSTVGKGDVLDISIWEAPPAALFGGIGTDMRQSSLNSTLRSASLPEQMVDSDGEITVPFAGTIKAGGRTPQQIARDIILRLNGKAHDPQVVVSIARNATSNVTVVGDVTSSTRVPLTAKGERLLDALASAGGVKQPIDKMTIQVTRGSQVQTLPLETVIRDPRQNIRLQPDDVITALFQPFSFTALGAAGTNAEVPFEGTGITLAQALGRVGGLQDLRADASGVFIFRMEDPIVLGSDEKGATLNQNGRVPVIYRVDLKNPSSLFVAQAFPIRNKDVLYISNAPLADLQKFVNIISSTLFPAAALGSAIR